MAVVATFAKLREDFAQFAESPSREDFREFLRSHVGEHAQCDFKENWPAFVELARDIIAIANSGGGVIVIGVAEKEGGFEPKGIQSIDENVVNQKIEKFLPKPLQPNYCLFTFTYADSEYSVITGLTFQVVVIGDDPQHLPFLAAEDGEEARKKIDRNVIYARSGSSTQRASYEQIQAMVNRRIETGYSSRPELELERHLSELKLLYNQIRPMIVTGGLLQQMETMKWALGEGAIGGKRERNPNYPTEDYEQFAARMIVAKKRRIAMALDVADRTEDVLHAGGRHSAPL